MIFAGNGHLTVSKTGVDRADDVDCVVVSRLSVDVDDVVSVGDQETELSQNIPQSWDSFLDSALLTSDWWSSSRDLSTL